MSATYRIENEALCVCVSDLGAEISSILDKRTGRELLWQPNEAIWNGQAPVLFPLIGRLKEGKYTYRDRQYSIASHGFARHSLFAAMQSSPHEISFSITDSEKTRGEYPFAFRFTVQYALRDGTIEKTHIVENRSDETMYYELGGHEGYNLNLYPGARMTDFYLKFSDRDFVETYTFDSDIMLNRETKKITLKDGVLPLNMELFRYDALVLRGIENIAVELWNAQGRVAAVSAPGFDYMGIWTKFLPVDTKYICIEPWTSLPDANFLDYELTNKIGIRALAPGERETLAYSMGF